MVIAALLVAAGAAKLARLDGASCPTAISRAGVAFGAALTLAAAITTAFFSVVP